MVCVFFLWSGLVRAGHHDNPEICVDVWLYGCMREYLADSGLEEVFYFPLWSDRTQSKYSVGVLIAPDFDFFYIRGGSN